MPFKVGDRVTHRSDKKPRNMVVAGIARKTAPPTSIHDERANIGHVSDGSHFCTWIAGAKKGEGYFVELELELAAE